tara:strand:+ start:16128 stop:16421 length:294 start_codon:yes stop_codon:yes gene_type:complete
MRNILIVSRDICDLIPNDDNVDDKFNKMKHNINRNIIESVPFAEPAMIKSTWFWNKLSVVINNTITYDDYDNIPWCKKIIDIFQDPNYKLVDPTSVN